MSPDAQQFLTALRNSARETDPFRHWTLADVLTAETAAGIRGLSIAEPQDFIFDGRRESNNAKRVFFNPDIQSRFPATAHLAEALQAPATVREIERECGTQLSGRYLRIEYCRDQEGFWLEPHTDIGPKKFTFQVYLNEGPDAESLGTDLFGTDKQWRRSHHARYNSGLIFVPGSDTFHGFRARAIQGIRMSLIINYVGDEWRNRHELAFPDQPIAA